MKQLIPILLIALIFLSGCISDVSQENIDKSLSSNMSFTQHEQSYIVDTNNNQKNISAKKYSNNNESENEKNIENSKDNSIEATSEPTENLNEQIETEEIVCPEDCNDNDFCTEDYCSETTNFECVHKNIIPCCGNANCEGNEDFSSCPNDCINPCPDSCEDNNPFTKGICDETTNFECVFEEANCGEEDNICPPNGEFTEKDGGCYNSDDVDCSLFFSYNIDQNYACGNSYNFRQFAFRDNKIFWLNNEYSISDSEPTTKDYNLGDEIINTVAVDSSNIYFGTNQNKILIFDRESSAKVNEIIVDDYIASENEPEIWLLYVDENQIYSRISSYGVLIFNKENFELVKEILSSEMLFFVDNNYIYIDDGAHLIIYDKNNFNELKKIDTTLEKSKFGSNNNYFVNIEKEIDNHFHLKIWNKDNWEISHKIDLGVKTGNIFVSNNEIYIGGSSSDFTERHIKKYDFNGNFQGKLWGNHGMFAIPIYTWNDCIIVFTQVTKDGGSGTCLFLQNWIKE